MGYRVAVVGATGYVGGELIRLLDRHPNVELTDPTGYVFPVATDSDCRNRLLHSRPIDGSAYLGRLWAAGIRGFTVVFNLPDDRVADVVRVPDTGTLRGDLIVMLEALRRVLAHPVLGEVARVLVAERDPVLVAMHAEFVERFLVERLPSACHGENGKAVAQGERHQHGELAGLAVPILRIGRRIALDGDVRPIGSVLSR